MEAKVLRLEAEQPIVCNVFVFYFFPNDNFLVPSLHLEPTGVGDPHLHIEPHHRHHPQNYYHGWSWYDCSFWVFTTQVL